MTYEYKIVGAPEKGKRKRGMRRRSDRVAAAFADIIKSEAVDGWEYLRTDLLPIIEGAGWFRRGREVNRAVMVFRRMRDRAKAESTAIQRRAPSVVPPATPPEAPAAPPIPERAPRAEPEVSDNPDLRLADALRAPGGPGRKD